MASQHNNLQPVVSAAYDEKIHKGEHHEDVSASELEANHDQEVVHPNGKKWEKKTMHKVDARLIIILGLCYAASLIDRTNISAARVAGMQVSLDLGVGDRYSIISLLFFIPYILFELPANIVLRKVGARLWLSSITVGFGVVMLGMAFVTTWWQLAICRVLLGALEAGFFPGCVYLISSWYTRYETSFRLAAFYLTSMFISGFSNILGYAMSTLSGRGGLLGWQWIFLIFGVVTIGLGLLAFTLIVDFPEKNKFLTEEQTQFVVDRINRDRGDATPDPMTMEAFKRAISDWKVWVYGYLFMTSTTGSYAFAFFLPVILSGGGFSAQLSLMLSAPPYCFAAIFTAVVSYYSDRTRLRAPFIAGVSFMGVIGLLIAAYTPTIGVRYFGCFLVVASANCMVPMVIAYSQNNVRMSTKRAVTSAITIGFGGIGGIIASTVFRQADFPRYIPGLWVTICLNLIAIGTLGIMSMHFKRRNRMVREKKCLNEMSDTFEYTI